jgi:hypothetical protein
MAVVWALIIAGIGVVALIFGPVGAALAAGMVAIAKRSDRMAPQETSSDSAVQALAIAAASY